MYRLHFLTGPHPDRRMVVREGSVTLGSGLDCHIRIADTEVLLQHAVLEESPNGTLLRPAVPNAPLMVNGRPVTERHLRDGDVLRFGQTQIRFQLIRPDGMPTRRRRTGLLQRLTLASVIAVLLIEGGLLLGLLALGKTVVTPPSNAKAVSSEDHENGGTLEVEQALAQSSAPPEAPPHDVPGNQQDTYDAQPVESPPEETPPSIVEHTPTQPDTTPSPLPEGPSTPAAPAPSPAAVLASVSAVPTPQTARATGVIRIARILEEEFATGGAFDEARLLRIELRRAPRSGAVEGDEVRVLVTFYDENEETKSVEPTQAVGPPEALRLSGRWPEAETRALTAAYLLPAAARPSGTPTAQRRSRYFGYVVRVFYRGELQDEWAAPISLLKTPSAEAASNGLG